MQTFSPQGLRNLYVPPPTSHKGQNGKLMLIGGSELFHAASLWSLKVASRIVDMVYYSSVPENNQIVQKVKTEFRDGIVVARNQIEDYIQEADCVLIGPGMVRNEKLKIKNEKSQLKVKNLEEIDRLKDEGEQTYYLTKYLLFKYKEKKWVIDAGSLQMIEPEFIPQNAILTPHQKEFETLFNNVILSAASDASEESHEILHFAQDDIRGLAKKYNCVILLKGEVDIVCSSKECVEISGGNAGMTKGGTGDVLAGLVAGLYCKNDAFLSACAGSYINKKAGESLFKKVGYYFNASDLADEIPKTMKELIA